MKKNILLQLISTIMLILILFVNIAEAAAPPDDISDVEPAQNEKIGIDYDSGVIITGKVNGEYDSGYSINLTKETFTVPAGYKIAAYSIDGGTRWTAVGSKPFDNAALTALFNSDITLAFTDKYTNKKPTTDATVVKFAKIKKRPKFTNTYVVNYSIGADSSGLSAGTWLLTAKNGTESVKEGIEVAVANAAGKAPDSKGYGKFYGSNGSTNGIEIAEMQSTGKAVKTSYFIRKGATANSDGTYTAASESTKIIVEGQSKNSAYAIDKNRKVINYPANTYIYRDDYNAPELKKAKGTLDISNYNGDVYLWSAPNETAPASAIQRTTVTSAENNISAATETVITLPETSNTLSYLDIMPMAEGDIPVTSINLNKQTLTLTEGNIDALTATVLPTTATNKALEWTTTNPTVATVAATGTVGIVTATGVGQAYIIVTNPESGFSAQCLVIVSKREDANLQIETGGMVNGSLMNPYIQTLTAKGGTPPIIWSIKSGSLPDGLMLSPSGVITGTPTRAGTYNFDIAVSDSAPSPATVSKSFSITIDQGYVVNYNVEGSNGTVTATINGIYFDGGMVGSGTTVVLSATPSYGYAVEKWIVYDDKGDELPQQPNTTSNTYSLTITSSVRIAVTFKKIPTQTIRFYVGISENDDMAGGTLTAQWNPSVGDGETKSTGAAVETINPQEGCTVYFTAERNTGYRIKKWEIRTLDGEIVTKFTEDIPRPDNTSYQYNLINISESHKGITVTAIFEKDQTWEVTFSVVNGVGGTLTAGGKTTTNAIPQTIIVSDKGSVLFTANPTLNAVLGDYTGDYQVQKWEVSATKGTLDQSVITTFNSKTTLDNALTNLQCDVTVKVTFEPKKPEINTTPAPPQNKKVLEKYEYTFTAKSLVGVTWKFTNNTDMETAEAHGLSLDPYTGKLSGTPTKGQGGTFTFSITATNNNEQKYSDTKEFTIHIYDLFDISFQVEKADGISDNGKLSVKVGSDAAVLYDKTDGKPKSIYDVLEGTTIVFTAIPDDGSFSIVWTGIYGNDGKLDTSGSLDTTEKIYTVPSLSKNLDITVSFAAIKDSKVQFYVEKDTGTNIENGYIEATKDGTKFINEVSVSAGKSAVLTAYPDIAGGYQVVSWKVWSLNDINKTDTWRFNNGRWEKFNGTVWETSAAEPPTTTVKNTQDTVYNLSNLTGDIVVAVVFGKAATIVATGVEITPKSVSVGVTGNTVLTARVYPINITDTAVTWRINTPVISETPTVTNLPDGVDISEIVVRNIGLNSMLSRKTTDSETSNIIYTDYASVNQVSGEVLVYKDAVPGMTFQVVATTTTAKDKEGKLVTSAIPCTVTVEEYRYVSALNLKEKTVNLTAKTEKDLKATVDIIPADASNKKLTWSSSDTNIAEIDAETGMLTAIKKGTAQITVTTLGTTEENTTISGIITVNVTESALTISPSTDKNFGSQPQGYGVIDAYSVTVGNSGNNETGPITVTVNSNDFVLSDTSLPSLNGGDVNGFTITPASGLSGGKTYYAKVTVSSATESKSFNVQFTVTAPLPQTPPSITSSSILINGTVGTAYSVALTATGSTPITWDITSGSLPTGLNMSNAGVISGTPTTKTTSSKITVKATNAYGSDTKQLTITIDALVAVTGVSLNTSAVTVAVDSSTMLTATVSPVNAADKSVTWSSSDSSIARVDNNGKITGIAVGKTTITVKTTDGGKTATCTVTVTTAAGKVEVTGLTLNKTTLTIAVGGSGVLTPIVAPANATETSVTWKTTNPNVAVPDQYGRIYGLSEGTAVITATTTQGNKAATCMVTVTQFPVTGVTLNKTTTTLAVGDTDNLSANIAPSNAGNKSITWSSNNTTIATVDQNGKITAKAPGTANITVMTLDGNKTATCTVYVTGISATGITMKSSSTIPVGGSETLVVTFNPADATNKNLTWTSDNTNVATVDSTGKVTAKSAGTAAVTAKTADGKTTICSVTVNNIVVTGITIKNSTTIAVGSSETLTPTIAPTNATNKTILWSSSNTSVATVDANGKVNGIASGVATITASTADGNKTAVCTVVVEVGYIITLGQSTNGTATSSHVKAAAGTKINLTELPYSGYYLVGWQVSPADLAVSGNSFIMPTSNVTITPVFQQILNLSSYINPDNIDTRNQSYKLTFTGNQLLNGSAGVCLPGSTLANISSKNSEFIIEIATPYGTYQIPANLASVVPELNDILTKNNLKISDIGFNIIITDKSGDKSISNALANSMPKAKVIGSPVDFKIEIVKITNGKPGAVIGTVGDNLTKRIARLIPLPQSVKTMPQYWGAYRYNQTADRFEFVPHTTRVINDILYVIVNSASNSVYVVAENPVSFTDVSANAWYAGYIYKSASKRLVQGVGNGLYQPERNVTRAEFVQMMVTALQLPKAKSGTKTYSDVTGDWYYDSIMRAKSAGLLAKFTGDKFNPNQAITREEMAVILTAVIRYEKFTVTGSVANLAGVFTDYSKFNKDYASDVEIVYRLNIMQGMGGGLFSPKGTSTRAQAATVLIRVLEMLKLID